MKGVDRDTCWDYPWQRLHVANSYVVVYYSIWRSLLVALACRLDKSIDKESW